MKLDIGFDNLWEDFEIGDGVSFTINFNGVVIIGFGINVDGIGLALLGFAINIYWY